METEHTHTECDYCGLTNFKCTRWHHDALKDNICGRCESYEYGDMDCYRVGVEDAD